MPKIIATDKEFVQPITQNLGPREPNKWMMWDTYIIQWNLDGVDKRIVIKGPVEYDKASVPIIIRGIPTMERDGSVEASSLLHDVMSQSGGVPNEVWSYHVKRPDETTWHRIDEIWTFKEVNELYRMVSIWGGQKPLSAKIQEQTLLHWLPYWWNFVNNRKKALSVKK